MICAWCGNDILPEERDEAGYDGARIHAGFCANKYFAEQNRVEDDLDDDTVEDYHSDNGGCGDPDCDECYG